MCSFWALATWSATTHRSQLTCAHVGLGSRQLCVEISCCRCWWCGSSTLGVWSRTPGGELLGPVARCLNCGSYEHGILIISLENLAPPTAVLCFFFFSLQLALGGFNFVFRGILANIRQTFSLFAFFGCQRESVKTNDCTSLPYAMENAVAVFVVFPIFPIFSSRRDTFDCAFHTQRKSFPRDPSSELFGLFWFLCVLALFAYLWGDRYWYRYRCVGVKSPGIWVT